MRCYSSYAFMGILAVPALSIPHAQPPIVDRTVVRRVDRDLKAVQELSFSKKEEALIAIGLDNSSNVDIFCSDCTVSTTLDMNIEFDPLEIGSFDPKGLAFGINFVGTSAHLDLDISVVDQAIFPIPLFALQSPIGFEDTTGILSIGVIPSLDIVFDISAGINLTGGIDFTVPDNSFIRVDLNGDIVDHNFKGTTATSIPWKVTAGNATIKTDLRLRVQAGVEVGFPIDLAAVVGVDINLIEHIAEFTSDPSSSCSSEVTENFNVNAGAYVELDIDLGPGGDSLGPTASTTFFNGPTFTHCPNAPSATYTTKPDYSTNSVPPLCA